MINEAELKKRAAEIRVALFDVDGVMTDGQLYYTPDGSEIKAFHSQDGFGLKHLMRAGIEVGVITGRDTAAVTHRMASLGITLLIQGCSDKAEAAQQILKDLKMDAHSMCFVGDDLIDVAAMQMARLAVAVPNAHASALAVAHWVTPRSGGRGAVRDVCDLLLESRQ